MASTRLSYLAIKRESTAALAVKPSHFLRFKDGDVMFKQDIIANNPIQNNRWNALNAVKGKATAEWTYNVDLDANECVHFLAPALGGLATTDVSSNTSAYRHDITVANTLPTVSIEQGKGNLTDTSNNYQNFVVHRAYGVMIDSFTLSGSDGILNLAVSVKAHGLLMKRNLVSDIASGSTKVLSLDSAEGFVSGDSVLTYDETPHSEVDTLTAISIANKTVSIATLSNSYTVANKAKVELQPQSPSYGTAAKVFSFIHARFQFGADLTAAASASLENIEDWELTFMNNLEERHGSLRETPSVIAPKGAKATFKYTKYFENSVERDRYLNQTKRTGILTITNDEIISAGDTNNSKYKILIQMSDVRFTSEEMPTGTDELYAISVEAECYYDTSDGQAIQIKVTNAKAGTEYTA